MSRFASAVALLGMSFLLVGCEDGAPNDSAPASPALGSAASVAPQKTEAHPPPAPGEPSEEEVRANLAVLAGQEPPGGWTGQLGPDMEWCMAELGFTVTPHEDGAGYGYEGIAEQEAAMDAAFAACDETRYRSGHYDPDRYFTDEYLSLSYDNRLDVAECLREAGFEISDPPSREVFIEQTAQQRLSVWEPLMDVPDQRAAGAERQCPGRPAAELLEELGQ